jgi:hypothetical protein
MIVALELGCLVLLAALDCFATSRIVRSGLYTSRQKAAQVLVIWLVPIVGPIVVLSVLKTAEPPRGYASAEDSSLPGMDSTGADHSQSDSTGHGHPN